MKINFMLGQMWNGIKYGNINSLSTIAYESSHKKNVIGLRIEEEIYR